MTNRRNFFRTTLAGALGLTLSKQGMSQSFQSQILPQVKDFPVVVSTWSHGLAANEAAWKVLQSDGSALDAVEKGIRVSEQDPEISSVGYGGWPDREGNVTLDACIMDETGNAGSVVYLQHIKHPVSVARLVMELTPHVYLAGKGALDFATANGFVKENLLTQKAKTAWEKWIEDGGRYEDRSGNHDTIGMISMDKIGNLSGACSTSGLSFKMPGRVGDSPIIGSGLYVDNEVGAATATGEGELIIKIVGSFLIVELMRNGYTPEEACRETVNRINLKCEIKPYHQIGFIALSKTGTIGAYGLRKGFNYAVFKGGVNELCDADYLID